MPLFASGRDASLIRRLNKELLHRIVCIEVEIYKPAIAEMIGNIYGETSDKRYYHPVRASALIRKDDTITLNTDSGELNNEKTLTVGFLRDDLFDLDMVIEVADIINWDAGYYQVDNVRTTSYWWGRNPDTLIGHQQNEFREFGYAVSVIAEVHRTAISNLNLVDVRSGINNDVIKNSRIPRNL